MIYTALTKKAMKIAFEAHKDQVDKTGMPYICHPLHLAEQMKDEVTTCIALLHDVIEDTDMTPDRLKEYGFGEEIIAALKLLTHDRAVPYMDYIWAIKGNGNAAAVKIADLRHNSDLSRFDYVDHADKDRVEKYKMALEILSSPEPQNVIGSGIEAVFTRFCEKYIVLMETLYKDKELNEWCRNYSAYREITSHKELREMIYGVFMKEAYALNLMPTVQFLGPECGSNDYEKLIAGTKRDLIYGICIAIRIDYGTNGSLVYESIAKGYLYRLMYNLLHYDEINAQKSSGADIKPPYRQYTPNYIWDCKNGTRPGSGPGSCRVTHDAPQRQWRMRIQLEEKRLWFLSVFMSEGGALNKYSLDEESASDSHYEFTDEAKIRSLLYEKGDENRYLDEIFIRWLGSHSGKDLLRLIMPYVTAQFHF